MKYYIKVVVEDNVLEKLIKDTNLNELSKQLGITQPYLYKVFNGDYIVSEQQYNKLKNLITEKLANKNSDL